MNKRIIQLTRNNHIRSTIEWHKWQVQFDEINKKMLDLNFSLVRIIEDNGLCGVAFYRKEKI